MTFIYMKLNGFKLLVSNVLNIENYSVEAAFRRMTPSVCFRFMTFLNEKMVAVENCFDLMIRISTSHKQYS